MNLYTQAAPRATPAAPAPSVPRPPAPPTGQPTVSTGERLQQQQSAAMSAAERAAAEQAEAEYTPPDFANRELNSDCTFIVEGTAWSAIMIWLFLGRLDGVTLTRQTNKRLAVVYVSNVSLHSKTAKQ